jgi:elongation factor G
MEIPESYKAEVETMHTAIVEKAAEQDEALMNSYFEAGNLTIAQIKEGLRKGTVSDNLYLLMCGSSLMNK